MIFDGPNEEDVELMDEDTRTFGGCKIVETCSALNLYAIAHLGAFDV